MTRCYLGLGSNLRSPARQLRQAINLLKKLPRSQLLKSSSFYLSESCGLKAQPSYCNVVVAITTTLSPSDLLRYCQRIEHTQLRVRKKKWGHRTLDIDVLLYGKRVINTPRLTIPHPNMLVRDFVLVPLLEIAPNIKLPNEQLIANYLKDCQSYLIIPPIIK